MDNLLFSLLRMSNFALGRGTVFWAVSLWAQTPPPRTPPLAHAWSYRFKTCLAKHNGSPGPDLPASVVDVAPAGLVRGVADDLRDGGGHPVQDRVQPHLPPAVGADHGLGQGRELKAIRQKKILLSPILRNTFFKFGPFRRFKRDLSSILHWKVLDDLKNSRIFKLK